MLFGFSSLSSAETKQQSFTNKQFLELPQTHQKFWIQGAMHALGLAAAGKSDKIGKCVINWYFGAKHAERNGLILASMKKYPQSDPSAVFIALTENACGKYQQQSQP